MKRTLLTPFFTLFLLKVALSQSFPLVGDGRWYRVAVYGGQHAHFEYTYSQPTGNNPSIATGEFDFINFVNYTIQHHQTMGYAAWNQPQFALVNHIDYSEIWVKATNGLGAATFTITKTVNLSPNPGDISDADLTDNGGTLTVYDKLDDNANTYYSDVVVPLNHVSIGTSRVDPNYHLAVNGNIHAKQVNVDLAGWPDYVFKPAYHLPSLTEVKSYIDQNGHLPETPSAAEIDKNGLDLGGMNKLLLKKVEELTLYLIEKDRQFTKQSEKSMEQEERLKKLEQQLNTSIMK